MNPPPNQTTGKTGIADALTIGYERVVAWSDLLDRVNVFPVYDSDTGQNLKISLAPFKQVEPHQGSFKELVDKLKLTATGNSGNIAAAFFSGFLSSPLPGSLPEAAQKGCRLAKKAVADPRAGTMLDLFESLARFFSDKESIGLDYNVDLLTEALRKSVEKTVALLPALKEAGVVDSGALGMFLFLEGFFKAVDGRANHCIPVMDSFKNVLQVSPEFKGPDTSAFCVDVLVRFDGIKGNHSQAVKELGESVVIGETNQGLKIHLHTRDAQDVQQRISDMGTILEWRDEPMETRSKTSLIPTNRNSVHIMTDAAGSITADRAAELKITLLDSFVVMDNKAGPETLVDAAQVYSTMTAGKRVSTAQASLFQRTESFRQALEQYGKVLYLCVGSVYTGNYAVADQWIVENGVQDRMRVVDTGAASGRLGLIAETVALESGSLTDMEELTAYSSRVVTECDEHLFLNQLKYLAMGGRISKTSSMMGDLLSIRPIISPRADGAKKIGTVRTIRGQIRFAAKQLKGRFGKTSSPRILLEYSDNRDWVESDVMPGILETCPRAHISLVPLSLTSGVHMGPGTWGMAFINKDLIKRNLR